MAGTDSSAARRRAFCRWYAVLGDPCEAAVRAGYPQETAAAAAAELLAKPSCRRELAAAGSLSALSVRQLVIAGLKRLAFGRTNDAFRLLLTDAPAEIGELDLFPVSAVRRDKNGSVELRFFDRQKALEQLLVCAAEEESQAAAETVLSALRGGEEAGHDAASDGRSVLGKAENSSQLVEPPGDAIA